MSGYRIDALVSVLRWIWRVSLPGGPLLSLDEVAEALPVDLAVARAWIVEHVQPAAEIGGVPVYRWSDVVATSEPVTGRTESRAMPPALAWWTHEETCWHLRVERRTLAAAMRETPDHIEPPWIDLGSGRRHSSS